MPVEPCVCVCPSPSWAVLAAVFLIAGIVSLFTVDSARATAQLLRLPAALVEAGAWVLTLVAGAGIGWLVSMGTPDTPRPLCLAAGLGGAAAGRWLVPLVKRWAGRAADSAPLP